MKKLLLAVIALLAICACNSEREYLDYRGLNMGMSAKAMKDSLLQRGFFIDSTQTSEDNNYILASAQERYTIGIFHDNDTITDILENYALSSNDSTSRMWQQMHDQMEKDIVRPYMTHRTDLHKEAVYKTDKGVITLILMNTYTPTLTVRYSTHIIKY